MSRPFLSEHVVARLARAAAELEKYEHERALERRRLGPRPRRRRPGAPLAPYPCADCGVNTREGLICHLGPKQLCFGCLIRALGN